VEDPPGSGTYVISADCQFSNNAAGVDAGSGLQNSAFLKISNAVLTLGNTQTLSVGSFRVESGGAINIPKGGNIQVGKPLWVAVIDQDGDGYYNASSGTDPEVSATQPTGKVRKNVWAANGTDCNDNSSNVVNANMVWRTLFGAPCLDNDSDQYGSILTGKTCAGGTGDLSAVSNSVYTNIAWLSTPDTNDVTNYGAGNLRTSCLGEDCDDEDPEHNVTCCLPKDADCTLDSQCCGTKCCNGKCGSSCCWSADGTNCDGGCTSSSVASATVYTGCSQGSLCSGTNCWKYGGSCNAGCTGSGYTSDTVNTACRAHAVSRCGYSASCATNANQNPSINDGEDPVTAYELTGSCAQGSGNCYIVSGTNYTNHYTASALCPF